jgi:pimeloyl-ACP methyl ester carboxylesterase
MSEPSIRRVPLATGLTYNVLEWDSPSDRTILLLHGFLDNAWTWEPLVAAGLGGAHVLAPDWRGHGDSDWIGPGGYYHFLDYVADLASLVDQLARRRLAIVAHSMGGAAASYYAGTFPQRLEGLVLIEGLVAPETTQEPARVARWIDGWQKARSRGTRSYPTLDEAAARVQQSDPELDPALARRLAERGVRRQPDGQLRFKHDPLHTTSGPYPFSVATAERFWSAVTCPVLFIDGGASPFQQYDAEVARRRALFPHGRHAVVAGTGHSPQRHRPAEVANLIAQHLSPPRP